MEGGEGTKEVTFVVERDGSITDVKKEISNATSEAMRS
jgi:outer membrane biosynthesis protein TonB